MTNSDSAEATHLDFVLAIELVIVQCVLRHRGAALVHVLHERDILLGGDETHFVQVRISTCAITASEESNRRVRVQTHCEKRAMSWSFVTLSGRFCRKRILFGGRYSSGIWTFGRLATGAAPDPSTRECQHQSTPYDSTHIRTLHGEFACLVLPLQGVRVAGRLCAKLR